MKTTRFLALPIIAAFCWSVPAAEPMKTVSVGKRPESVCRGFDGKYFVTVMYEPNVPGDGKIRVMEEDGAVSDFAAGLDEPKGICFTGEYLVTTDQKRLWKVDAEGRASVLAEESAFPGEIQFLNDIAAARDGKSVYVTDMGSPQRLFGEDGMWELESDEARKVKSIGRIFRVTLEGEVSVAVGTSPIMPAPNGVSVQRNGRLLIGDFFRGTLLEARKGRLSVITLGYRGADAVERDRRGNLYVSSWTQGKVWKLDKKGHTPRILIEGLQSAADFFLDEKNDRLLLPDMLAGTVLFVPTE